MPSAEPEPQAARRQLERVLGSPGFARNDRLSRFLRFVVGRRLEGRDQDLKESVIALEIFGRQANYDPKRDPIVRTEAIRLRARLGEYYLGEGKGDPLIIEIPKGGYAPVFREVGGPPEMGALSLPRVAMRVRLRMAVAAISVVLTAAGWWWIHHRSGPITIAVLPLENLSHDPANDYFADGLTDELIRNLSVIDGLTPRSRTSSFAFKGKPRNVRDVGKDLDAEYVLEGSVLLAGPQLRINAQLIRARDDFPVWSERCDRDLTDVLAIQDDISRGIVNSLRLKLGRGRRRYETSVEAYDIYLRARALQVRLGLEGLLKSVGLLEQAVAKDPTFAPAWAGLAWAYAVRSGETGDPSDLPKMRVAVERALRLDPLLAEAHTALGVTYAREAQWDSSEKSFRRALEIDPNNSLPHALIAIHLLLPLGRIEEAVRQVQAAEKRDPLSPEVQFRLHMALLSARRFDELAVHCEKSPYSRPCLAQVLLGQGRIDQAIRILEAAFQERAASEGELGYAYARAGRRQEAQKLAAVASPLEQAQIFAGLGDKDRAFEALERAIPLGPVHIGVYLNWPDFDPLRGDPRLKALRRKVGLPE